MKKDVKQLVRSRFKKTLDKTDLPFMAGYAYPKILDQLVEDAEYCRNRGEDNINAKLNQSDIKEIFKLCREGLPRKVIASRFMIGVRYIAEILSRKRWSHVEIEDEGVKNDVSEYL